MSVSVEKLHHHCYAVWMDLHARVDINMELHPRAVLHSDKSMHTSYFYWNKTQAAAIFALKSNFHNDQLMLRVLVQVECRMGLWDDGSVHNSTG